MTNKPPITVRAAPSFQKSLKKLRKRYPNIKADLLPLLEQLEQGQTPGDRVKRVGKVVFKVRIRNTDAQRGKSGGYRVLYYLQRAEMIQLIEIYSKSDTTDISADEIEKLLSDIE